MASCLKAPAAATAAAGAGPHDHHVARAVTFAADVHDAGVVLGAHGQPHRAGGLVQCSGWHWLAVFTIHLWHGAEGLFLLRNLTTPFQTPHIEVAGCHQHTKSNCLLERPQLNKTGMCDVMLCAAGSVSASSQRTAAYTVEGHSGFLSNASSSPSRSMASGEQSAGQPSHTSHPAHQAISMWQQRAVFNMNLGYLPACGRSNQPVPAPTAAA
jgi:hypothetical protein